jgi:thiosulfate/3-mercaptopyruvate sulfurtransferase
MKKLSIIKLSAFLLFFYSSLALSMQVPGPLVDVNWLDKHQADVVIIDVRKDKKSFTAKAKKGNKIAGMQGCGAKKGSGIKVAGHIPGAALFNWKKVRAKRTVDGFDLIKLVPTKSEMEALMRNHGVSKDSAVVITSKGATSKDMTFATRLYWQMKYWGHDNVTILNGGTAAWANAGKTITRDKSKPSKGNWVAGNARDEIRATSTQVQSAINNKTQLIDGRAEDYYLGSTYKKKYVYAAGHITNAKLFQHSLLVKGEKAAEFLPAEKLEKMMKLKGIDAKADTITYCDSGHLSSGHWFILHELLGNKNARLYDGSMHEWTMRKNKVVGL